MNKCSFCFHPPPIQNGPLIHTIGSNKTKCCTNQSILMFSIKKSTLTRRTVRPPTIMLTRCMRSAKYPPIPIGLRRMRRRRLLLRWIIPVVIVRGWRGRWRRARWPVCMMGGVLHFLWICLWCTDLCVLVLNERDFYCIKSKIPSILSFYRCWRWLPQDVHGRFLPLMILSSFTDLAP